MINIFIFRRDLRLFDNTTLINMLKNNKSIIPIFIFTPEQIDIKKNKYFSNNSVQFMIESLKDLNKEIKKCKSKLYFFKGDNIKVLSEINKKIKISSIGFNIDYSPYATKRDSLIKIFCDKNNIKLYTYEDYSLYPIIDNTTYNKSGKPYTVFTPFKNNLIKNHVVRKPDKLKKFTLVKEAGLKEISYYFNIKNLDTLYTYNSKINVTGGRNNGLKILKNLKKWDHYNNKRNCMDYKTTFLSAYLHFNVVSIRETYYKILNILGKDNLLINELHWRDFYMNISYNFPRVLKGMISKKNISFREAYDKIKWSKSKKKFKAWTNGKTGYPIVDACMNQLNTTGYMHNRGRMIVASFLTKHLMIDWRMGEKYFAQNLVDYDCHSNNGGWQWSSGSGTDAQPYFRIFNPWTQTKNFDPDCSYIKKWVPIFKDIDPKDIHKWEDNNIRKKHNLKYPEPIVNHKEARELVLKTYKKALN
tara:strand:+ start:1931 stop:3349 length:1419 start_codon:yes stop_codon:yes gene_type:complete